MGEGLPLSAPGHWVTAEGREIASDYVGRTRESLCMGDRPDFVLANDVFMADRSSLDLIAYQTAAKERIRWLSAQLAAHRLAATPTALPSAEDALRAREECAQIAEAVAEEHGKARADAFSRDDREIAWQEHSAMRCAQAIAKRLRGEPADVDWRAEDLRMAGVMLALQSPRASDEVLATVSGGDREYWVRVLYGTWPHTVISPALADVTGLPLGAVLTFAIAKEAGADFGGLYRYADAIVAALTNRTGEASDEVLGEAGGSIVVRKIETVAGDFLTEPGEPFWRIEINGYCADFDHEQAARNFADQIATLSASPVPVDASGVERLVAAVDAWIDDPDAAAEQEIMDARDALHTAPVADAQAGEGK